MVEAKGHAGLAIIALLLLSLSLAIISCQPSPPAAFQISTLSINPAEVKPGENVTVTAKVTNTGGSQGNYVAELKVNEVVERTEQLTLMPNESKTVSFTLSKGTPGTYEIKLGILSGRFAVQRVSYTWTLSDAEASRIWGGIYPNIKLHFLEGNKVDVIPPAYEFQLWGCPLMARDGKLCVGNVPRFWYEATSSGHAYTEHGADTMCFTKAWFDTKKEIGPGIDKFPYIESVSTSEGKATLTYRWP